MTPRLDAIGLVVSDLARSLDFYRRLGVAVPDVVEGPHAEADLGGGVRIMWDTEDVARALHPGWTRSDGGPDAALAARCDSSAEVDAVHDEMIAAGARSRMAPFDAPWGQRYAQVEDPDGHAVDLYAPLS